MFVLHLSMYTIYLAVKEHSVYGVNIDTEFSEAYCVYVHTLTGKKYCTVWNFHILSPLLDEPLI